MAQPVGQIRGFFDAFFALPQPLWSGFLAGWPGLPNNDLHESWDRRLLFALQMFVRMRPPVQLAMMLFAVWHTALYGPNTLLRSVLPGELFAGDGDDASDRWAPPPAVLGDEPAKVEARAMIERFERLRREKPSDPAAGWNHMDEDRVETETKLQETLLVADEKLDAFPAPFN